MAARIRTRSLKRKNRSFVPSVAGSSRGAVLEQRISAATLFYRPVDPTDIIAEVSDGTSDDENEGLNYAAASLMWSETVSYPWEGPVTYKQTGAVANSIYDVANPGGSSPAGSSSICVKVCIQNTQSTSGSNFIAFGPPTNVMDSSASGARDYTIANSDGSGGNVTVQEKFCFSYTEPASNPNLPVMDVGSDMVMQTPGFYADWIPEEVPYYSVSAGSTLVSVTTTNNYISLTVDTTVSLVAPSYSVPWDISYGAQIKSVMMSPVDTTASAATNSEALHMHYSASFVS
jgi:hypothetical protein